MKFDSSGNFIWNRNWNAGGDNEAWGTKTVRADPSGNVYVAGRTVTPQCPTIFFNACDFDVLLLKLDPNGGLLWAKTWKGSAGYDTALSLAFDPAGNIVVTGARDQYGSSPTALLLRYDSNGNLLSSQTWSANANTTGFAVIVDPSGNILVGGSTPNNVGVWQDATGLSGNENGTLSSQSGAVGWVNVTLGTPSGTVGSPTGVTDTGGGGQDAFLASISLSGTPAPPAPTGLSAVVGAGSIYLRWDPYPLNADAFVVAVSQDQGSGPVQLGTVVCDPRNVQAAGTTILQLPSCLLTSLPDGTQLQNSTLYTFTIAAKIGSSQSPPSNPVSAMANGFPRTGLPPKPNNPILFLHGFCGDGRLVGVPLLNGPLLNGDCLDLGPTWSDTLLFVMTTLKWNYGGQLYHYQDSLQDHIDYEGKCIPATNSCTDNTQVPPQADFFTASFGDAAANYNTTPDGLVHQGIEVQRFLKFLQPQDPPNSKITLVAHSNGGLAARSYLSQFPSEAQSRVSELITYGSPHIGADVNKFAASFGALLNLIATLAGLKASGGARDAGFICGNPTQPGPGQFLLNNNQIPVNLSPFLFPLDATPMPSSISYTSIIGKLQSPGGVGGFVIPTNRAQQDDCQSKSWDGLVPTSSADLNNARVTSFPVRTLQTNLFHLAQGGDFPTILCALDSNCAEFQVLSPVDIKVIAPNGQRIGKSYASIPGASYMEIVQEDGRDTANVLIPFPQGGQYTVNVVPKPGAQPTDTFTITLTQNGVTATIADHVKIQDIPPDGFHPHVNSRPFAKAGLDQTVECQGPNGTSVTLDGSASGDQDGDPLTFVWTDSQGNIVGNAAIVTVLVPMGAQTYNLTVTDPSDLSATAQMHVTVRDTTPPVLTVTVSPSQLWPPNNKLVSITANIQVSDLCDPNPTVTLVSITSNEPDSGLGDIQAATLGTDDRSFSLRATRLGSGTGRIYTVTYQATDHSGNTSLSSAQVSVPHDQGQH